MNASVAAPVSATASVHAYHSNTELVASLETEVVAWIDAFCERVTGGTVSDERQAMLAELAARRRERARATAAMPWNRVTAGLSELEQLIVAYLLTLRESPRVWARVADIDTLPSAYRGATWEWRSIGRILSIFCADPEEALRARRVFALGAPLFARHLIEAVRLSRDESLLEQCVGLSADTAAALMQDEATFSHLRIGTRVEEPTETLRQVVLPEEQVAVLRALISGQDRHRELYAELGIDDTITYGRGSVVLFHGPPGTGKTLTARAMAGESKRPLIVFDPSQADALGHLDAEDYLEIALAEAERHHGILFIDECDEILQLDDRPRRSSARLLTILEHAECLVVLATNRAVRIGEALERRLLYRLRFDLPDTRERIAIWRLLLPSAFELSDEQVTKLASRYLLAGGYIKNAILQAVHSLSLHSEGDFHNAFDTLQQAAEEQASRVLERTGGHFEVFAPASDPADTPARDNLGDEVLEVAELVRRYVDEPAMQRLNGLMGEKSFRVLVRCTNVDSGFDVVRAIGRQAQVPVLRVPLDEVSAPDEASRRKNDERRYDLYVFLGTARQRYLLTCVVDAPASEWDAAFQKQLRAVLSVTEGVVFVVASASERQAGPLRPMFHRELVVAEPRMHVGSARAIVQAAGFDWTVGALAPEVAQLPRRQWERVLREAVHRAIGRHDSTVTDKDLQQAWEHVKALLHDGNEPLFGRTTSFSWFPGAHGVRMPNGHGS